MNYAFGYGGDRGFGEIREIFTKWRIIENPDGVQASSRQGCHKRGEFLVDIAKSKKLVFRYVLVPCYGNLSMNRPKEHSTCPHLCPPVLSPSGTVFLLFVQRHRVAVDTFTPLPCSRVEGLEKSALRE